MYMTDSGFEARYPEQKPVCFNYAAAREDMLACRAENFRLRKRLATFEEGMNPDVAERFSQKANGLIGKLDALLGGREKAVVTEISQFLHESGFEEAAEALEGRYSRRDGGAERCAELT